MKSRDITLPTKVHLVKAMVFPVVMYGYVNGTVKKSESIKVDAFELWCWRKLLRVPWATRSNQSIPKEISPEYSLEGLMMKLKPLYFGHLIQRTDWLERKLWWWERLKAEGEGDNRGWDGWIASLTQWPWVWATWGSWWWTRMPGMLQSMVSQRVGHNWATELNWTELTTRLKYSHQKQCLTQDIKKIMSATPDGTYPSSEQLERLLFLSHYDSSPTLIFPLKAY